MHAAWKTNIPGVGQPFGHNRELSNLPGFELTSRKYGCPDDFLKGRSNFCKPSLREIASSVCSSTPPATLQQHHVDTSGGVVVRGSVVQLCAHAHTNLAVFSRRAVGFVRGHDQAPRRVPNCKIVRHRDPHCTFLKLLPVRPVCGVWHYTKQARRPPTS